MVKKPQMNKHIFFITADLKTVVLTYLFPFLALKEARYRDLNHCKY